MYRFCIALEEMDSKDVPIALVLGCGPPQLVRQRADYMTVRPSPASVPDREFLRYAVDLHISINKRYLDHIHLIFSKLLEGAVCSDSALRLQFWLS